MAVGTTTDFSDTGTTLIEDALRDIGALGLDESMTANQSAHALRHANRILKGWQAKTKFNLWRRTEGTITPVASTASYALSVKALRVHEARWIYDTGNELNMIEMSRNDYTRLPDKAAKGIPTTWFYDAQRDAGTFYIWPVPDTISAETIKYTYDRPFFDFDAATENPDVPQEWLNALKLAIQASVYTTYFPSDVQGLLTHKSMAEEAFYEALDFDREHTSLKLKMGPSW